MGLTSALLRMPFIRDRMNREVESRAQSLLNESFQFPPRDPLRPSREEQFKTETKNDYLRLYEKHIWFYSSVYAIASSLAQIPLRIYALDKKGQRQGEVLDGWLYNLINRPNPYDTYYDFMENLVSYLELTGDTYIEKNNSECPTQLYILRPDFVEIKSSAKSLVTEYVYAPDGAPSCRFQPDEIIHIRYFHPRSELYGFSFPQAATAPAILDFEAIKFQKKFFKQGGAIDKFITIKKELNKTEFARFKEEVLSQYAGTENAHKPMVLDNDGELKSIGVQYDKMMLEAQRALNRDEIFSGAGVPPIMANLLAGKETYNNASTQEKAFWQNTIIPKARKIEAKFNVSLFWKWGFECGFDFGDVTALQEDKLSKAQTASTLAMSGVLTVDEIRSDLYGKDPMSPEASAPSIPSAPVSPSPEGSAPVVPPSVAPAPPSGTPTPLNGAQIQSAMGVMQSYARKEITRVAAMELLAAVGIPRANVEAMLAVANDLPSDAVIKAQTSKKAARDLSEKLLKEGEEILFNQVKPVFAEWSKKLTALVAASGNIRKAKNPLVLDLNAALDKGTQDMMDAIIEGNTKASVNAINGQFSRIKGRGLTADESKTLTAQAKKSAEKWAKKSTDSIVKTMNGRVESFMGTALKGDMPLNEVTAGIQNIFEGSGREEFPWARAIARTESLKAVNSSNVDAMKAAGFKYKTWIAGGVALDSEGNRTDREDHTAMDETTVGIDEVFVLPNGAKMRFPGDPDAPVEELVNCRCGVIESEAA